MRYGVVMNSYGTIVPKAALLKNTKLSKQAKQRLKWMDFYESHQHNARLTCRHFGISPDVFYRWKRRYRPGHLLTLEDHTANRRPKHLRQPQTNSVTVARLIQLRERYPRWGKKKLHVLLVGEGHNISQASVGRSLSRLRTTGRLHEPPVVTARLAGKKRRRYTRRPHALKRDWSYIAKVPGDLVQVDSLHVWAEDMSHRYQFTAQDYVSKFTARTVATRITSSAASLVLDAAQERLPMPIKAIQVDGGSEFMAVFEKLCAARGITLYVLPPRSPKLNGMVERLQRTSREEVYDLGLHELTTIEQHNSLLKDQDHIYNYIRPHEALGLKTPNQYYEAIKS